MGFENFRTIRGQLQSCYVLDLSTGLPNNTCQLVPVAQLDRALASGAETCLISACPSLCYKRFPMSKTGCTTIDYPQTNSSQDIVCQRLTPE
jgi:hypothetical protein